MSTEHHSVNRNVFEGEWKEIQGQARERWGRLASNDLESMEGQVDQLIGRLQQEYGHRQIDSAAILEGSETIVTLTVESDYLRESHRLFARRNGERWVNAHAANQSGHPIRRSARSNGKL